ncbi:hypothetical protein [uncultured Campylobacter sp.]|uniref:hypothetical protein n=1 Tax=uncultured Campylobacter sp. TaxID=218934 RepID=UPI00261263D3|nr:hypothetical protein [uncultured Campylobacter sp.]
MKFLEFSRKQTECGYEILKFLGAKRFSLRTATTEFLNFTPASHNGFEILKFTPEPLRNRFGILKFTLASARLADTAQNFISRNRFKILKFICAPLRALRRALSRVDSAEAGRAARLTSQHAHDAIEKRHAVKSNHVSSLDSAQCRIVRLYGAAARHGYEVGRVENFSKFSLTNALLNFISLLPRKFKLELLKFTREVPRDRSEILNFTPKLSNRFEILKFTLAPHKFKPAPIPLLNFISNFTPHASAFKFENGVKFKGAAKFERSAR